MNARRPEDEIPATIVRTLGLLCPLPVVHTARALRDAPAGAVIEVLSDDPGFLEDMPAWCGETGHELLEMTQDGGVIRARIRKTGAPES